MKWLCRKFYMSSTDDDDKIIELEVEGLLSECGRFGIYEDLDWEWSLTHIGTGYSIVRTADVVDAMRGAAMIQSNDWDFTNPKKVQHLKEPVEEMREIFQRKY